MEVVVYLCVAIDVCSGEKQRGESQEELQAAEVGDELHMEHVPAELTWCMQRQKIEGQWDSLTRGELSACLHCANSGVTATLGGRTTEGMSIYHLLHNL